MIKDAKHAEKELRALTRPDAVLTFVPRKDITDGSEHPDQPVPKLTFKNPAIFPKNEPQGVTQGLYIPGKVPNNKFEMEQLQREWAVIKSNAVAKEVLLDEWPPLETPIVVQIEGRMTYAEGMMVKALTYTEDGHERGEYAFMEIIRKGDFEYSANAPVKFGADADVEMVNFIPVDFNKVIAWAYLTTDGQFFAHPGRFRQPIDLFVDCEFDDTTKTLLSVGITTKTGTVYYAFDSKAANAVEYEWVNEHVVPILLDVPPGTQSTDLNAQGIGWGEWLEYVMTAVSGWDKAIYADFIFHMDFPTDVEYISRILHLGEGRRIGQMRNVTFKIEYVDAYPTQLKQAVQHNAAWDSLAIWMHLGYLSYRVMMEIQHSGMKGTPSSRETLPEKQKVPPLLEAMIQNALTKSDDSKK